jgi:ATP-dependent DNA helicase DinG
VVVATATKALQDQLAGKDLPFVTEHLTFPFSFAVLKGRSNYLCRQRAREVITAGEQLDLDDGAGERDPSLVGRQVQQLLAWADVTTTGDRAELDFEPKPLAWGSVSVSAMECPGAARCPSGGECFAEAARQRAEEADVVVVNTHLYGAHLASGNHVLPEHDVVVFDEAHELNEIASSSLGFELGAGRFRALARTVRGLVADASIPDDLEVAGARFEQALLPWRGRRLPEGLGDDLTTVLAMVAERIRRLTSAVRDVSEGDARKERALQAAGHLAGDLAMAVGAGAEQVVWVEGPPHAPILRLAPLEVGPLLAERLWENVVGVLTSATIPPGLAPTVGLPADNNDQLDVGSPFDFEHHSVLYCAAHLPDPRSEAYEAALHQELEALISAAGGRTLALFTSWRAMHAAADALAPRVPFRVMTQADLPKPALLAAFSGDETSCLFATMGFWQGVDVPGPALSLVTIDRLPFPRPDEPLLQARRQHAGPAAFRAIDLPRAATLLAQGAGRLIRTATDRGVVAVCDPRLAKAGYRWDIVHALPPMRRTKDRVVVDEFLRPLREASSNCC